MRAKIGSRFPYTVCLLVTTSVCFSTCILPREWKRLPGSVNNLLRRFHPPKTIKCISTSRRHYHQEREQREILFFVFTRFHRFSKGDFCTKPLIFTGSNGRLKPSGLLSLTEHIGNKALQFSTSCCGIQGARLLLNTETLLTHPVYLICSVSETSWT